MPRGEGPSISSARAWAPPPEARPLNILSGLGQLEETLAASSPEGALLEELRTRARMTKHELRVPQRSVFSD